MMWFVNLGLSAGISYEYRIFELCGDAPSKVFDDAIIDTVLNGPIQTRFRNPAQTCVPNALHGTLWRDDDGRATDRREIYLLLAKNWLPAGPPDGRRR